MQDLSRYAKRDHIEIQTKYLSILMVVSVTLVGLVFAIGVLVGSRHAVAPTCPQSDALSVLDSQSREPPPPSSLGAEDLTFHESLSQRKPDVPTPASLKGKEVAPASSKGEQVPDDRAPREVAPMREEPAIPESVSKDEPGVYTLQVGSFKERVDASELVHKLTKAGYGAFLVSVKMPDRGGTWYRVRVGPFDSHDEVWEEKRLFEEKEQIPAFVVKRREG